MMLLNNSRRRHVAMMVFLVGLMMLLGSLNISSAFAADPGFGFVSFANHPIIIRDYTGVERPGYLTAELDTNLIDNQVTGTASLYVDGNTYEIQYTRIYEIGSGADSRILELRGTSGGVPVKTTITVTLHDPVLVHYTQ